MPWSCAPGIMIFGSPAARELTAITTRGVMSFPSKLRHVADTPELHFFEHAGLRSGGECEQRLGAHREGARDPALRVDQVARGGAVRPVRARDVPAGLDDDVAP